MNVVLGTGGAVECGNLDMFQVMRSAALSQRVEDGAPETMPPQAVLMMATVCGAVCGTSTVSSYVEASAGIAEGGKTGLAAMATGGLFLLAMFFSPVASLVPNCATAAALIYVGILMMDCTKKIDWQNTEEAVPAFLTLAIMPMTYNISYGIAFGVISHVLIQVFSGKRKSLNGGNWIIAGLFTAMFLVTH